MYAFSLVVSEFMSLVDFFSFFNILLLAFNKYHLSRPIQKPTLNT